ncbi:11474_t:CDS:2, partial [Ambispora gerdemannii]
FQIYHVNTSVAGSLSLLVSERQRITPEENNTPNALDNYTDVLEREQTPTFSWVHFISRFANEQSEKNNTSGQTSASALCVCDDVSSFILK